MRAIAARISIIGFFVLAGVGWACGVDPLECGLKALQGAAVLFVLSLIAGKIVVRIVADAIVRARDSAVKEDQRGTGSK